MDNVDAMRGYQGCAYRIASIDSGVVDRERRMKRSIPLIGYRGIPIRNELATMRTPL